MGSNDVASENNLNLIYKKEIDGLRLIIKNIQDSYDRFCDDLSNNDFIFDSKKNYVKKKKLDNYTDYNILFYLMSTNDSLVKIYNDNIRGKDRINVDFIHIFYKKLLKYLYDTVNLVRLSYSYKNNKTINPLINIYLEEKKNGSIQTDFFNSLECSLSLIKNDSIRSTCTDMTRDFKLKREEINELEDEISNNYRRLELFMHKQRKNNSNIDDIRWYSEFLKRCCSSIEEKDKQKRID